MSLQPVSFVRNGDTVYASIFSWLILSEKGGKFRQLWAFSSLFLLNCLAAFSLYTLA